MQNMQLMEGWVINDANLFIQSFKQLTYIQDRKKNLENRNDSFYYFELLNEFQNEIGRQRCILLDSYNDLKRLFATYNWLPIWKRIIQRTNDIIEVSKMPFPFEITDQFFVEEGVIEDVINYLGKKEEDGEISPIEMMKIYGKNELGKSVYYRDSQRQDKQDQEGSGSGNVKQNGASYEFFKQSHMKYLQSVKSMCLLYQGAMDADLDIVQTKNVFTFNHDKPLSVNLQIIYGQMLTRNQHIEKAILGYLKLNQSSAILRRSELQNDIASLSELHARFLSQSESVKNFQSQKVLLESSIGRQMRRFSNFVGLIDVPAFLAKKVHQRPSIDLENLKVFRKSRDSNLLVHAITQIQRHKSMKIRKVRQSTSTMKTAQFNPHNQLSVSNSQFYHKKGIQKINTTIQTSKRNIESKIKIQKQKELRRQIQFNIQNISPSSSLNYGIVVQNSKNIHLIETTKTTPSYKQYIKKNGINIVRVSACF